MTNKLIRLGSTYTIGGEPYRAARPAYDTYQTVTGYNSGRLGFYRIQIPVTNQDGSQGYTEETRYDPKYAGPPTAYTTTIVTHHPADPGSPGTPAVRQDYPPQGWTSSARSLAFGYENVRITFKATNGTAAVGLSDDPAPRVGLSHIPNGLLATGGTLKNLRSGAGFGSYVAGDVLRMDVDAGTISYKVNGVEVGTDTSTYDQDAALYMSAVLYGAGDSIDVPTILQLAGATPATPVITVTARMAPMVTVAFGPDATDSTGGAPSNFAMVHARMAPMEATGFDTTIVVVPGSEAHARMEPMVASSLVLVGGLTEVRASMAPMVAASSDTVQLVIRSRMAPMVAYSYDDPVGGSGPGTGGSGEPGTDGGGVVYDHVSHLFGWGFGVTLDVLQSETVETPIEFAFGVNFSAIDGPPVPGDLNYNELPFVIGFGVNFSTEESETVSFDIVWGFDVPLSVPGAGLSVYVVNLKGGGSTEYTNYPFESYARIGDHYYGAALDGLYVLEGDDDDGVKIQAIVCPGTLDFGSAQQKTIVEAWLGVASPSPMAMKVHVPGDQFLYHAQNWSNDLKQHRFKLGKGVKANYITPVLYNMNGADFEVDALEFNLATLSRKTGR